MKTAALYIRNFTFALSFVLLLGFPAIAQDHSNGNNMFTDVNAINAQAADELRAIKLYPNPASDFIKVRSDNAINLKRIAIADILGNTVWEKEFENHSMFEKIRIPLYELKNGIYFVEFESDFNRVTRKISKE